MQPFPALLDLATQKVHPLGNVDAYLVGRNETANLCVVDSKCSRFQFRILHKDGQHLVERLNALNPTYLNGTPLEHVEVLRHGDQLQAGQTRLQFLLHAQTGVARPSGSTGAKSSSLDSPAPALRGESGDVALAAKKFELAGSMVMGRDPEQAQIHLPHPQVSRCHASIHLSADHAILTDLGSGNGTFLNGKRLKRPTPIHPGDQIDIGPYALRFDGSALVPRGRSNNIELVARNVTREVVNRETGKPLLLLDDITLVIRPHEFVCLLGPSGSGKSTLLSAMSGRAPVDGGHIQVNGTDLYANFESLKHDIAVVPQKDVLHDSLAVGQALRYTAKLRLPSDTSAQEIEATLAEMLETVGLSARRATVIRNLSGGQVKRASLANEIICKPSLLFLDEVTSGLDEQTDREVMNLFRSLADAGKTVVCVTHSLANVERTCHLVVVLTAGGKLAFAGKPAEALGYFSIDRLGDVYDRLAEKPADHWQAEFLKSPHYKRYVESRLPADQRPAADAAEREARSSDWMRLFLRQTILSTSRYAAIWRGDYSSLLAMVGQAIVVAVLLCLLFGDLRELPLNTPQEKADHGGRALNLMFLLAVSSFWFGCNNAAKEIVKERTIYTRERDFNLLVESYYCSKLCLLTFFSFFQAIVLFTIVRTWCGPPGPIAGEMMVLLTLALAGVTLGLAISTLAPTEEMAITLIPMAVIPQIILSGSISPLEGITKAMALLGITTFWGKRGLDACLPSDVIDAVLGAGEQHSFSVAVLVLLAHSVVFVSIALTALHWQSRRHGLAVMLGLKGTNGK